MNNSFRVRGRSDRFVETDAAWLDQCAELFGTMRHHGVPIIRESADGADHKGALDTIVVTVSSAGSATGCAAAWRAWLGRDHTRWIELTGVADGVEESAVLRAADLAEGRLDQVLDEFAQRFRAS
jgi:hypothetical protein